MEEIDGEMRGVMMDCGRDLGCRPSDGWIVGEIWGVRQVMDGLWEIWGVGQVIEALWGMGGGVVGCNDR